MYSDSIVANNGHLHFACPEDEAVTKCNDVACMAPNTVCVARVFVAPQPGEVGVGVAVEGEGLGWCEGWALVGHGFLW